MRPGDLIWWAWGSLKTMRTRVIMTMLGIIIGTAAVVALVSATQGYRSVLVSNLSRLNPDTIIVVPRGGYLSPSDIQRLSQLAHVEKVIPVVTSNVRIYGVGGTRSASLFAIDPSDLTVLWRGVKISEGELYTSGIGSAVSGWSLAHPEDLPYPFLTAGTTAYVEYKLLGRSRMLNFRITGIFDRQGATALFADFDNAIYTSIRTVQALTGRTGYTIAFAIADDSSNVNSILSDMEFIFGKRFDTFSANQILSTVNSITSQFQLLMGSVASISMIVAGLGILNTMLISVIERTREIGILKAVGYKDSQVMTMFLAEALTIGVLGGLIGLIAGVGGSYLIPFMVSMFFHPESIGEMRIGTSLLTFTPQISLDIVFTSLLLAIGVAALAGVYPARRAAKLDPIVALRHE